MKVSILTPTYNRAHTLQRLYDSICQQSIQGHELYEWIVVDDGSSDNTIDVINKFIIEGIINIRYLYQENAGKPSAINTGVLHSKGRYIFIVDSDDVITNDAIATIGEVDIVSSAHFNKVISGFCFRKSDLDGNMLGCKYDNGRDYILMNATECGSYFSADLAYIFKREFLLENPFPKFGNEKFVPELFIWNKITDIKPVLAFPKKSIYLVEYLEDGLSNNFKSEIKKSPRGFALFYKDQIKREKRKIVKIKKIARWLQCISYSLLK